LKKDSGLAAHIQGLRVPPRREIQCREEKLNGRYALCNASLDCHFLILVRIHWAGSRLLRGPVAENLLVGYRRDQWAVLVSNGNRDNGWTISLQVVFSLSLLSRANHLTNK
jgi:hypothetical protein